MRRLWKKNTAQHKKKASKSKVKDKQFINRNILMQKYLYSLYGISVLGIVWSGSRLSIQQIGYGFLTPQKKYKS
jgi:hypothetical protein